MPTTQAIILSDLAALPPNYATRSEIVKTIGRDISQNTFSYAARSGKLGDYYGLGGKCYYSTEKALSVWTKPGKATAPAKAASKKVNKKAKKPVPKPTKVSGAPATKSRTVGLPLLTRQELPDFLGRTPEEVAALLADDRSFLPPGASLSSGEPLWSAESVRVWLERFPAPPTTLTISGNEIVLSRPLKAGTYKIVGG